MKERFNLCLVSTHPKALAKLICYVVEFQYLAGWVPDTRPGARRGASQLAVGVQPDKEALIGGNLTCPALYLTLPGSLVLTQKTWQFSYKCL